MAKSYDDGTDAERRAAEFLKSRGFEIIGSRTGAIRGTGAGEIDIIARRGRLIVFTEVKKRSTTALALESIGVEQRGRIYLAAEVFLASHPEYEGFDCRLDAFAFGEDGRFEHVENAWGM